MIIKNISEILNQYLSKFPFEAEGLNSLKSLIEEEASVTSRKEFRGHVTCGAIVLNPENKLLMVHHRILDKWLFPGGHLEIEDESLRGAALRELEEETGVRAKSLSLFDNWLDQIPLHIDKHIIPSNEMKNEPEHDHYDFRFLFNGSEDILEIQEAEIFGAAWVEITIAPEQIRHRLLSLGFGISRDRDEY